MKKLGLTLIDPWLEPYEQSLIYRHQQFKNKLDELCTHGQKLSDFASGHLYFGLHKTTDGWIFREWAPNATQIFLIGDFSDWKPKSQFELTTNKNGYWEISFPDQHFKHGDFYKLYIVWKSGTGERIPSYSNRVVQDPKTLVFTTQVWCPENEFTWSDQSFKTCQENVLLYEAHVGMSSENELVSSFNDFRINILPRIKAAGYNTIQLMAIQEHPYYGSFGYHVSNYFAVSSRFGTPDDLKALVNEAHLLGINVIMDLVHSHAVKNELEGLGKFDGTTYQYFHEGEKGNHPAWDSRCFNYGKNEVVHFLLSNCRYWMEEFHFDGFRFDGVTSMLYFNHGLEIDFTSYSDYFQNNEDIESMTYLALANTLIHEINPSAISIAEEMSGYPGVGGRVSDGGLGFDYRLSMGVPDFWIKLVKDTPDEHWGMSLIFHELTQHRPEEKTINYTESHDQALVGDKTLIFRLVDKEMYDHMHISHESLVVDRGIALHKLIRLITIATHQGGYLNFMGNEFGHPEWIDFPREGNGWSYRYARRQWSLVDNKQLKFHYLDNFDKAMIQLMSTSNGIASHPCYLHCANEDDKIMAFSRGNSLFVFNFHSSNSYTGYGIPATAGKYKIVLTSDKELFGGFNRVDEAPYYFTVPLQPMDTNHILKLYLPSRVAVVLTHLPTPKIQ